MQCAIEEDSEFGLRLDGTHDGDSCSLELRMAVLEDLLYK
jgi:hypothetical protein